MPASPVSAPAANGRLRDLLPRGNTLDDDTFRRRHWIVCALLGFHLPAVAALGLRAEQDAVRGAIEVAIPMAFLYLALHSGRRRVQAVAATAGLAACSAAIAHLLDGSVESRFHVFVVVGFVALYQDWFPYLCAVAATAAAFGPLAGAVLLVVCVSHVVLWRASETERQKVAQLATDLALAQSQADARAAVGELFVNLARRNQVLLDRQLALIVAMEDRTQDPDLLGDLFQLDHLATRIRRNAESLLVLSGEEPARRWGRPVALADVVRAAVAEVEEYRRTDAVIDEGTAVAGRAVADLAHLLAELVENGLQFSPPESRVRITHDARPDGRCVLLVEDRGIGMSDTDLLAANELVARPPEVDARLSKRLGFHVVARLAARYGLRVRFRPTPGGGVTVEVVLPPELVTSREAARNAAPAVEGDAGDEQGAKPLLRLVANGVPPRRPAPAAPVVEPLAEPVAETLVEPVAETLVEPVAETLVEPLVALVGEPPATSPTAPFTAPLLDPASLPVADRTAAVVVEPRAVARTEGGLPRRVPKASMHPDMRRGGDGPPSPADPGAPATPFTNGRSPAELRSMLSKFQAGQAKARAEAGPTKRRGSRQ